jgi:4-amino-4-deoxy-L-arabinose transferase-like glycosyltransferase
VPRALPPAGFALLLGALLFGVGLGAVDLWGRDEPRYARVAYEMVADGHWLVPHFNGTWYGEKPPLCFWAIAVAFSALGVGEVAARLPSALAATLALWITWRLASRMAGRRAAWLSVLLLATAPEFFHAARYARLDMALTLGVLGCVSALRERRAVVAGGWAGLALLAKGPQALLFVLCAAVAHGWRDPTARLRPRQVGALLGVAFLLFAAWLVPAALAGGAAFRDHLIGQPFSRVVEQRTDDAPSAHAERLTYYLERFPAGFAPGALLLLGALVGAVRAKRRGPLGADARLALGWLVGSFVLFSLIAEKREVYLLPLYPAAALVAGLWVDRAVGAESLHRRRILAAELVAAALIGVLALVAPTRFLPGRVADRLPGLSGDAPWLGTLLVLGGLAGLASCRAGRDRTAAATWFALWAALLLAQALVFDPRLNERRSSRDAGEGVAAVASGHAVAFYGPLRSWGSGVSFYSRRLLVEAAGPADLARFLDADPAGFCMIAERDLADPERVPAALRERLEVVASWPALGRPLHLLREREGAAEEPR